MKKRLLLILISIFGLAMANALFAQDHLLITEFVVTPTAGEFIEIYNPTADTVDLSNYYLTDEIFRNNNNYINIVKGGFSAFRSDYMAKFPAGTKIAPGQFITIAISGANFLATYGKTADFELKGEDDNTPDMDANSSIGGSAGLSNGDEVIILFYWDGQSDLVQDVDIVVWGDKDEAVDKTGVKMDGPDADTDSTEYAADTPKADQYVVNADNDGDSNPHDFGMSAQRRLEVEDLENWSASGNGMTGHDETGENTSWKGGIWSINEPPTPGWRALSPKPAADSLTIADANFIRADSIGAAVNDDSPFLGDTLSITGVWMQGARDIFLGNRWGGFMQDARGGPWSGFFVIQNDTSSAGVENTLITAANPGDTIRVTGIMAEFPTGSGTPSISQLNFITDPVTPIEFIGVSVGDPVLPDPILLTPGDLGLSAGGSSADPQLSERWEGVLARFEGLTVLANGLPGNTLTANDETGTIILDDYFNAVSIPVSNNGNVWPGLPAGTKINVTGFVRGGSSQGFITINPRSLDDVEIASSPPEIQTVSRDPAVPTSTQDVTISARIVDAQTVVASADLSYRVDGGVFSSMAMTSGADSVWSADIPAQADGAFVEYIVEAADDGGATTTAPGDTSASKFFYFVRDGGLTIKDVQFVPNPTASDASSFANLEVTVTGVVTTDSSDFAFYWIQDGTEPWSGVWVNDTANEVKIGDNVTVTGTVQERFGVTRINNVTSVVVNSQDNPVPDPVDVKTGDVMTGGPMAEAYEGMLIRVKNAAVANPFADGTRNFGEFTVDDGSGAVRVDDLGNFRGNLDSLFAAGDSLKSLTGIHHYTFSNHKIEPRNDADVVRKTTAVDDEGGIPLTFDLAQNYPNPFNPETTISYQIANPGHVKITIYNLLGQKIRTLVDEVRPAGAYKVIWDGTKDSGLSVASGMYFYKMQAADFVKVNKMLLMK